MPINDLLKQLAGGKKPEDTMSEEEIAQAVEADAPYAETQNDALQALEAQELGQAPAPEVPVVPEIQKTPLQELLEKSNALREQSSIDVKAAREDDKKRAMAATLAKSLGALGAANVQAQTGQNVGLKGFEPVRVQDTSKGITSERDNLIQQLQSEYKLIQAGKPAEMSPYQKAQLGESEKNRELKKKIASIKKAEAPKAPSFLEKEMIKADLKEKALLQKENRAIRNDAEDSLKDIDKNIANVKKAAELMRNASKSGATDTGPIDQYLSPLGTKGQKLRQVFNEISLDKMTKMFAGMSKAIDSDAERKFFEQSQVSMGSYPEVNMGILEKMLTNLESLKRKNHGTLKAINKKGEAKPEVEKVQVQTADGRIGTIPKSKVEAFLKKHPTAKISE